MRGVAAVVAVLCAVLAGAVAGVGAAPERTTLSLRPVVSGLDSPVHVAAPRTEPNRLYVVEQPGVIRVVVAGRLRAAPFLDIRHLVSSGGERGLLSLAFHPNYAKNRRLFVNYTDRNGDTRVVEYRSNGVRALPGTARRWLLVRQPYGNHNGGQLAFGPDGRLYVGMGDGGSGGDPLNHGQRRDTLLGKLLVRNVNVAASRWQVNALGLRNPWRFSFDRANGDLWIADVGQGAWEEIDWTPRPQLRQLRNYGWSAFEGRERYSNRPLAGGVLVQPVHVYGRDDGCSVSGGFVYRGAALPAERGRYFFGDYCTGKVWSLGARGAGLRTEPFTVPRLTSFGEDARGELYLVSHGGTLYRLVR
ncbi:MAG TPA: PQQ-dependent sugar dehydrogenase [Gaiellaceae bacterium]|nr:PQQ-dependent sugar dehydrogenase [Gaiellaceae bacterium]